MRVEEILRILEFEKLSAETFVVGHAIELLKY